MVGISDCSEDWIMDSGCTFQMTPYKHYFSYLSEFDGGRVIMGNDKLM